MRAFRSASVRPVRTAPGRPEGSGLPKRPVAIGPYNPYALILQTVALLFDKASGKVGITRMDVCHARAAANYLQHTYVGQIIATAHIQDLKESAGTSQAPHGCITQLVAEWNNQLSEKWTSLSYASDTSVCHIVAMH